MNCLRRCRFRLYVPNPLWILPEHPACPPGGGRHHRYRRSSGLAHDHPDHFEHCCGVDFHAAGAGVIGDAFLPEQLASTQLSPRLIAMNEIEPFDMQRD